MFSKTAYGGTVYSTNCSFQLVEIAIITRTRTTRWIRWLKPTYNIIILFVWQASTACRDPMRPRFVTKRGPHDAISKKWRYRAASIFSKWSNNSKYQMPSMLMALMSTCLGPTLLNSHRCSSLARWKLLFQLILFWRPMRSYASLVGGNACLHTDWNFCKFSLESRQIVLDQPRCFSLARNELVRNLFLRWLLGGSEYQL